ncbi:MAG: hypothetical protein ATN31_03980 [Candidatus Epulonipiscioides saccharophilum]|nr:MAG: hypothetical protein ATN31_03980 [Epulopiscium sp. AS2M-Bin001]
MKKALLVTLALIGSSAFVGCAAGYDAALDGYGYDGYYDGGVYYEDVYDGGPYAPGVVYEGPAYGVNDAGFNY